MDADPLFHVKQLFHSGSYKACIAEVTSGDLSDLSDPETLSRALYAARSHLALPTPSPSSAKSLLEPALSGSEPPASARAVSSFADYLSATSDEGKEAKIDELRDLVLEFEGEEVNEEVREEERVVRCCAGSAFILQGEVEEAVATLTEGCGKTELECTALLVQLMLSIDRRDLAQQTYAAAKRFGDDSLLVQVMEAWVGMKTGGRPAHQAYYLYEELYQLPSGRTPSIIASHAAAHLILGHVDEAKADIIEAFAKEGGKEDPAVCAVGASLGMEGCLESLQRISPNHPLVLDMAAKSDAFDEAAAKFSIAA